MHTEKIVRSYQYRVIPNSATKEFLLKCFKDYRRFYNICLYWHNQHHMDYDGYNMFHRLFNYCLKQQETQDFIKTPRCVFQSAFDRLRKASKTHDVKTRKHDDDRKLTFGKRQKEYKIRGKYLYLTGFPRLKLRWSRPLPEGAHIHNVILSKTNNKEFYVSFVISFLSKKDSAPTEKKVGIDMSLQHLCVLSEGIKLDYIHPFEKISEKLAKKQRELQHREKGSKNFQKTKECLSRYHLNAKRMRDDYIEKLTTKLAKEYQMIAIEDLDVKGIAKEYGKGVNDDSFYQIKYRLNEKMIEYGHQLVVIDRYYPSSQICHNCGYRYRETKDIHIREWTCPKCGETHDRDVNAAKNILKEGERIVSYR